MKIFSSLWALVFVFVLASCGTVGQQRAGIDNFDKVSPTLYRGAQPTDDGFKTLATSYGVKTIINLRDSDDSHEAQVLKEMGLTYIHVPLDAETVTPADAEKVLTLMEQAQGPVFVHCHVGRDRTGMAVAAYRVRVQGWTVDAALEDLYAHGHFWALFPKVKAAVVAVGNVPTPGMPVVTAGVVKGAAGASSN